jgi:hypothetical protein
METTMVTSTLAWNKSGHSCKHGKGVCANRDYDKEDLVLKDKILGGAQQS